MGRITKQNSITSAESISKINAKNKRLIDDFIEYLESTQKSKTTISVYKNDLDILMVWALEHNDNKFFIDWTKRDIVSLQNWLVNENKNSPSRVRRLKSTLSSMSNYIENVLDDEFPTFRNIIHKIESPPLQKVLEKTVFENQQLEWLLGYLVEKERHEKACMLALAMYSGRRKAELVRFRVDHFRDEYVIYDKLYKTPERIKTKGRGNGKMLYCYTLSKEFKPYLDMWIAYRNINNIDSVWLFPQKDDKTKHLLAETLNSWAKTFTKLLKTPFYWHSLRHFFTTHLVKTGLPSNVIQDLIGWTSADMVKLYTDISADEQLGAFLEKKEEKKNKEGIINGSNTS